MDGEAEPTAARKTAPSNTDEISQSYHGMKHLPLCVNLVIRICDSFYLSINGRIILSNDGNLNIAVVATFFRMKWFLDDNNSFNFYEYPYRFSGDYTVHFG